MYQLYASPNTYSIGIHLLLEEAGVPYRIINPRTNPAVTDSDFLLASPHWRVPAIVLPDGTTMCESGAIALHLADTLDDQRFTIRPDSALRGRYLQWLFYLSSTLQPEIMIQFHPEHYFTDEHKQAELLAAAMLRLNEIWIVLEEQYATGPWLFEQGPTSVDFMLATVLVWQESFSSSLAEYPGLNTMLTTLSQRNSFKRVMPWHRREVDDIPQRISVAV